MSTKNEYSRVGTFIGKGGHLYYSTDEGVVFYTTMKRLADIMENEQPHPVCMVAGLAQETTAYTPDEESPEGRAVADWIAAMESHLECMAVAMAERTAPPKLRIVAA